MCTQLHNFKSPLKLKKYVLGFYVFKILIIYVKLALAFKDFEMA